MDIKKKVAATNSQGNAAAEYSSYLERSGSWQYGKDASANDIEDEKREEDLAFGVPHEALDFDPKPAPDTSGLQMRGNAAKGVVMDSAESPQTGKGLEGGEKVTNYSSGDSTSGRFVQVNGKNRQALR